VFRWSFEGSLMFRRKCRHTIYRTTFWSDLALPLQAAAKNRLEMTSRMSMPATEAPEHVTVDCVAIPTAIGTRCRPG